MRGKRPYPQTAIGIDSNSTQIIDTADVDDGLSSQEALIDQRADHKATRDQHAVTALAQSGDRIRRRANANVFLIGSPAIRLHHFPPASC